jgi:hypothetical protein
VTTAAVVVCNCGWFVTCARWFSKTVVRCWCVHSGKRRVLAQPDRIDFYIQIITGTHTTHTVHDTHDMCTHVSWRVNIHFDLLEQGTVRVVTPKL